MNVRVFAAAVLVAALSVVAVGASGASGGAAANTLTVWLMVDAQSSWSDVVASASAQFKNQNPGWDVNVQYQEWNSYRAKLDATLAGGGTPDVVEIGNTQTTPYMVAGAFQDLTVGSVPEREHLAVRASRRRDDTAARPTRVPYYAGSRVDHLPHRPVQSGQGEDPDESR